MNVALSSVYNRGSEGFEVNVEPAGKGVKPIPAEPAKSSGKAGEQDKPVQKRPEKKADAWMENIREFIRNIDVKSL